MQNRKKRLCASLGALLVALIALAYSPTSAEATPFGCNDIGICSGCQWGSCEVYEGCETQCDPICAQSSNYLYCTDE